MRKPSADGNICSRGGAGVVLPTTLGPARGGRGGGSRGLPISFSAGGQACVELLAVSSLTPVRARGWARDPGPKLCLPPAQRCLTHTLTLGRYRLPLLKGSGDKSRAQKLSSPEGAEAS